MRNAGFTMDVSGMRRKAKALASIPAKAFKKQIEDFTRKSLVKAMRRTPVRSLDVIRLNQIEKKGNQYDRWMQHGGNRDRAISRKQFLADRAPARFLFQLSWVQVGSSLGLSIPASANIMSATTRNHNEPEPERGYGQWRGGDVRYSAVIYNPFLDAPPRTYKPFTGAQILGDAMRENYPVFQRACDRQLKRIAYAIAKS